MEIVRSLTSYMHLLCLSWLRQHLVKSSFNEKWGINFMLLMVTDHSDNHNQPIVADPNWGRIHNSEYSVLRVKGQPVVLPFSLGTCTGKNRI